MDIGGAPHPTIGEAAVPVNEDRGGDKPAEAAAHVIVVSAYNPGEERGIAAGEGDRKELYGQAAARSALAATVRHLTSDRVRRIEQRLEAGNPAQALLDTVGSNPANLIVVGNRGLGASEGQLLGSVPAGVVRNAVCDVLVVQTSALDEDRLHDDRLFAKDSTATEPARESAGAVADEPCPAPPPA